VRCIGAFLFIPEQRTGGLPFQQLKLLSCRSLRTNIL